MTLRKAYLDLDVLTVLRADFPELAAIKQEGCCEFIQICRDTVRYLGARKRVEKDENSEYFDLYEQIRELCTHGVELRDGTLPCSNKEENFREGSI